MLDLHESRAKIDEIDKEIVKLFEQRMEIAKEVASYKVKSGKKVLDKQREMEKLEFLENMVYDEFNKCGIRELFVQIMSMSRKLQYRLIQNDKEEIEFERCRQFRLENKKVVCFGAKASYTEQAMEEYFGSDIENFHVSTFKEVMEAIQNENAEFGVLPIENSSTGGITDIYDLLVQYNHTIIGEHIVKVEQALIGLPGARVQDIKMVYSHPQGLMQCSEYLETHKDITAKEYSSTSGSVKKVMEDGDSSVGAIASRYAAEYYGLEVIEESINQENENSTRFIIITGKKIYLENANKVSICFLLPHERGTLYNMLSHMIYNGLNMTKIESRPVKGKKWEYRFFIEFEGNLEDSGVKNAIRGMREEASELKILGNFRMI